MTDNILGLLGLMRKASALAIGENNSLDAVHKGKAKLIILPSDSGEKAIEKVNGFLSGHNAEIVALPFSRKELSEAIGCSNVSMCTVTDLGFARTLVLSLKELDRDRYSAAADSIEKRFNKAERRKKETSVRGKKNKAGEE